MQRVKQKIQERTAPIHKTTMQQVNIGDYNIAGEFIIANKHCKSEHSTFMQKRQREKERSLHRSVHRCIGAQRVLEDTSWLSSLGANGTPPTLSSLSNLFDPDRTCPCLYLCDSCPFSAFPSSPTPRSDLIHSLLGIFMVVASFMHVYPTCRVKIR